MTIELDHTIVPARDKDAAARFFARIFGLSYDGPQSHFAPVRGKRYSHDGFRQRGEFRTASLCLPGE